MTKINTQLYFSENHVEEIAQQIRDASLLYEKLFSDLGSQIFVDIVDLNNPLEIMAVCREHTDNALKFFSRHFPHNSTIVCEQGCSYCCYFPVTCPPQVIDDVANHIKEIFTKAELSCLQKEMQQYVEARNNNQIRIRCPFLTADNDCCIYEHRPLSCRSFSSSNKSECHASLTDNRSISQDPVHHRIFQAATTALMAAEKHNGSPVHQQDFVSSLLLALSSV